MALALRVVGVADNVEFAATLLVAPVIVATLLGGRYLGYVAAGVAAVAYLYLRFDDVQNAGAIGVVVLVVFRAASYGFVAYMTPPLFSRLAGVSDVDIGVPARHLRAEPVDPGSARMASRDWYDDEAPDAVEPVLAGVGDYDMGPSAYEPPPTLATSAASASDVDRGYAGSWADEEPLDDWSAEAAALARQDMAPPAPRVPTGWIDDATSPLGDETIPVGYTGELFLGRITGSVPVVPTNGARNGAGAGTNGSRGRQTYGTDPMAPARPIRDPGVAAGGGTGAGAAAGAGAGFGGPGGRGGPGPGSGAGDAGRGRGADRPAPAFSGAADADAGMHLTEPMYDGPAAEPDLYPDRERYPEREPYREPEPEPSREHWSARMSPSSGGSGEVPATPWTAAQADANWDTTPARGGAWADPANGGPPAGYADAPRHAAGGGGPQRPPAEPAHDPSAGVDPETRLWNALFFRDRLNSAIGHSQAGASPFSVVMVQVADEPFQPLPYRRQVALLRELGHQFVPRFVDHLVHLPDGAQHWFAVVLDETDRPAAQAFERRLRSTLSGYLRSRGLRVGEVQSASLTSPDDDEAMAAIWASLLGADNVGA